MKAFFLAMFLLAPAVSAAVNITFDDVSLEIPNPPGFQPVTPEMGEIYEMLKQFVPSTNLDFVDFISDSDAEANQLGDFPDLQRRFSVQSTHSLSNVSVPTSEFAKLKTVIKTQNNEIMQQARRDSPEFLKEISDNIENRYNERLDFSVSQIVPLPAHDETDRTLSYSAFVKYSLSDDTGNTFPFVGLVTMTIVHVKSKVLLLYTYAEDSDIEWSRDISKQWVEAIVLANPSDGLTSFKESLPPALAAINWGRVGSKAIYGAFMGMLIVIIGRIFRGGKARAR